MAKNIILSLIVIFLYCNALAQEFNPGLVENIAISEKMHFALKSGFSENQNYANWDITYQRMEWEINPAVRYIKGEITSYFKSNSGPLSEIEFDLHNDLVVDSVIYKNNPVLFSHEQHKITFPFETPLQANKLDSVVIFYQGIPPAGGGFGSFSQTTQEGNEVPIIWTLSEPYGAMEWWPCKQSLLDKIDSIDIIVHSPEPHRTASNGILISESVNDGFRTMHWKHRFPIAVYLVAIAVTNYVDYTDSLLLDDGRHIDILNYVYPENLESAKLKTPATVDIMRLFNNLIGEYPFASEKYGHAQFGWGGGMEHQTMSFMYNFNFDLVAHELAHQWFGDYITLASWHHIWLNEGFATYLTGLAYENLLDGKWWPVWKKLNVERITGLPDGSVYVPDTTSVSRIFSGRLSYSKGAYLLHMLRWILGDDDFFEGIRNYYNDPEVANGFARHEQFVKNMEAAGDTSLTEFFNDWYYGEGYPVYSLKYSRSAENEYSLKLAQSPTHQSVGFFEMPVEIRAYNSDKTDSIDFRLNHTSQNQEFKIYPGFTISDIKIDPDIWMVSQTAEVLKTPLIETSDELMVFPNPATNEISYFVPNSNVALSAEIIDIQGNIVFQHNTRQTTLKLDGLPAGIYVLRISTINKQYIKKFSKR